MKQIKLEILLLFNNILIYNQFYKNIKLQFDNILKYYLLKVESTAVENLL